MKMLTALTLVLIATPALATPLTPAQIGEIDRIAAQALKETGVPSASVAVVTDGKLQFAKAYGRQRGDASAPTTAAAYPIASVSKQITAAAIDSNSIPRPEFGSTCGDCTIFSTAASPARAPIKTNTANVTTRGRIPASRAASASEPTA